MIGSKFLATVALLYYYTTQVHIHCVTYEEDAELTAKQKTSLQKFRESVETKLPAEWMKKGDNFLIRFLREKEFNVEEAVNFLNEHLVWRKENKLDSEPPEDFSNLKDDYSYVTNGHDKAGRVIMQWDLGGWNIKKAIEKGEEERLQRYTFSMWNEASRKVAEEAAAGKKASRYTVVMDMNNLNEGNKIDPETVKFYEKMSEIHELHFPNTADKMFVLYAPPEFIEFMKKLKPLEPEFHAGKVILFGLKSASWKDELEESIDLDELPMGTIHD